MNLVSLTKSQEEQIQKRKELIADFEPIQNLKKGDVLRYKGGLNLRFPKPGGFVVVNSTEVPPTKVESQNAPIRRNDFTYCVKASWLPERPLPPFVEKNPDAEDETLEYSADSRFFERVEQRD